MKFASLGSGSSGNATLIVDGSSMVLLDCGFGIKETERRMQRLGITPADVSAIVVTHEHGDHTKGVGPLARKYKLPIFMTRGTYAGRAFGLLPALHVIENYQAFTVGSIEVTPVVVPHDARGPAQFVFQSGAGARLGVLTDLGSITPHIVDAYRDCHGLLVEANHDLDMLARGPYPPSLKSRVSSRWGHLNNTQTADFLASCDLDNLQQIVVGHISEKNNSLDCVRAELNEVIQRARHIHFACQNEGFDWLALSFPNTISSSKQVLTS